MARSKRIGDVVADVLAVLVLPVILPPMLVLAALVSLYNRARGRDY